MQDWAAWGVFWGDSWGDSWGPLHEVEEVLHRPRTNPNLRLRPIQEVRFSGAGVRLTLGKATGQVRAVAEEERRGVLLLGIGASLRLTPASGRVRASLGAVVAGEGCRSKLRATGGKVRSGASSAGSGAVIRACGGRVSVSAGARCIATQHGLNLVSGTIDDVSAVQNPTDEELILIFVQALQQSSLTQR